MSTGFNPPLRSTSTVTKALLFLIALTEYFANTGVVHVGTRFQDGASFLPGPDHERVHRSLDMLLLLSLMKMMMKMLL